MKLTDEQWAALEVLYGEIAMFAGYGDPMSWDDSLFWSDGIRTRLAQILEPADTIARDV